MPRVNVPVALLRWFGLLRGLSGCALSLDGLCRLRCSVAIRSRKAGPWRAVIELAVVIGWVSGPTTVGCDPSRECETTEG